MATRAAKPLALSRSGQPRRRLVRRRQHLPTPVLLARKTEDGVIEVEPVGIRELLTVQVHDGAGDRLLIEAKSETEVEPIVST